MNHFLLFNLINEKAIERAFQDSFFVKCLALNLNCRQKNLPALYVLYDYLENRGNQDELDLTHILIPFGDDSLKAECLGFVIVYFYLKGLLKNRTEQTSEADVQTEIEKLQKTEKLILPSRKKDAVKVMKADLAKKERSKQHVLLLNQLYKEYGNFNLRADCLIVLKEREANSLATFPGSEFMIPEITKAESSSFVCYTTKHKRDREHKEGVARVRMKQFSEIVLFDLENTYEKFADFSFLSMKTDVLYKNFKKETILTFAKSLGYSDIQSSLRRSRSHLLKESNTSWKCVPFDADLLGMKNCDVKFYKIGSLNWDEAKDQLRSHESLYELTSFKFKNILSQIISVKMRELIIEDIFNSNSFKILSTQTHSDLTSLNTESMLKVKSILLGLLTDQSISEARKHIIEEKHSFSEAMVSNFLLRIPVLANEMRTFLHPMTLISWDECDYVIKKNTLILDYRDIGVEGYELEKNLFELAVDKTTKCLALLRWNFFGSNYINTRKRLQSFSEQIFEKSLMSRLDIDTEKYPTAFESYNTAAADMPEEWIDWEEEYSSSRDFDSEKYRVTYTDGGENILLGSEQVFLRRSESQQNVNLCRCDELSRELLLTNDKPLILRLLWIPNIFEQYDLSTSTNDTLYLNALSLKYGVPENHIIWKFLLHSLAQKHGEDALYKTLVDTFEAKMVSKQYFLNNWLNPKSEILVPRDKMLFRDLCKLLNIDEGRYARIMIRQQNMKRVLTSETNRLLQNFIIDLANLGLLDHTFEHIDDETLMRLKTSDYWEDLGFPEENLKTSLKNTCDFLKQNFVFKLVEKIEKI